MENQLLIGYIDPTYKKPISVNEFSGQVEFEEAPCMIVKSQPFPMGATQAQFSVYWGTPIFEEIDEEEVIVSYNILFVQVVTLSGSDVENWGTDDSEILYAVAAKLGTTITQIVTANINL